MGWVMFLGRKMFLKHHLYLLSFVCLQLYLEEQILYSDILDMLGHRKSAIYRLKFVWLLGKLGLLLKPVF